MTKICFPYTQYHICTSTVVNSDIPCMDVCKMCFLSLVYMIVYMIVYDRICVTIYYGIICTSTVVMTGMMNRGIFVEELLVCRFHQDMSKVKYLSLQIFGFSRYLEIFGFLWWYLPVWGQPRSVVQFTTVVTYQIKLDKIKSQTSCFQNIQNRCQINI